MVSITFLSLKFFLIIKKVNMDEETKEYLRQIAENTSHKTSLSYQVTNRVLTLCLIQK